MDVLGRLKVLKLGLVLLGGEPGKTIFVNVDAKRVDTCQSNVDPYVELIAIDQERVIYVHTCDHLFLGRYLVNILSQEDSFALTRGGWFDDPLLCWVLLHIILELGHFCGQNVSRWQEFEMPLTVLLSHVGQVSVHVVFAGDLCRLGEMVYFLEAAHTLIEH